MLLTPRRAVHAKVKRTWRAVVEVPLAFEVRCSTSITLYRPLISRAIRFQWHSARYFHRMALRAQARFALKNIKIEMNVFICKGTFGNKDFENKKHFYVSYDNNI